ncbi:hypothetical protein EVAR_99294_1 [Eumeta japonica]|uniref:Uncharacterized protein n=1 Tax=Eumeta variegata TaxID=151549 RepID=A0A4C2A234_EUMVA|nr:hypothetical protein EVAR_99294_1 [Eumeta japonica]
MAASEYKARNSAAVKLVMKAYQWYKENAGEKKEALGGVANVECALHNSHAVQSGKLSCVLLYLVTRHAAIYLRSRF